MADLAAIADDAHSLHIDRTDDALGDALGDALARAVIDALDAKRVTDADGTWQLAAERHDGQSGVVG